MWAGRWAQATSRAHLVALLPLSSEALNQATQTARTERRDHWRKWCEKAVSSGAGPIFRWLKKGSQPAAARPVNMGSPGGMHGVIKRLETFWRGL